MDFRKLLKVAKKNNETSTNETKFYCTKYAPPQKLSKEKKLSENIQKFLQQREQEDRERQQQQRKKVDALMALRDDKSKNKIKKMLKVTKSANKSLMDDAITRHTPNQLDQEDFGFVSAEANAFHEKYLEKVKDVHDPKDLVPSRSQPLLNIDSTKARVKAALIHETVGSSASSSKESTTNDVVAERKKTEEEEEAAKNKKARRPAPPPMDFWELIKLAAKKQHEPVAAVQKNKEPERLLTMKQKREEEERLRWIDGRVKRDLERAAAAKKASSAGVPAGCIPKLNQAAKQKTDADSSTAKTTGSSKSGENGFRKPKIAAVTQAAAKTVKSSTSSSSLLAKSRSACSASTAAKPVSASSTVASTGAVLKSSSEGGKNPNGPSSKQAFKGATREFPPRDIGTVKARQFPPADMQKTRQFPPADVRRGSYGGEPSRPRGGDIRRAPPSNKRRILDDDDDSEYDSEMDDFIDDGDCEEDFSAHIKTIFGYDKSKYSHLDDEDDRAMETNFAQQQREEVLSKKAGRKEDLEDMRLEAMEKKRKMNKRRRLN